MSRSFVPYLCLIALAFLASDGGFIAAAPAGAPAQNAAASDMANTPGAERTAAYNGAMQAFQKGNWTAAAAGLEQFITMVLAADEKLKAQLGPIYYTLGAAYFNQPDFPKAIKTFKKFLDEYPKDEHGTEVRMALAEAYFENKEFEAAIKAYTVFESAPAYREQALTSEAAAYREMGKPDDQIRVLEKLIAPEIKTSGQARGAISLAELYTTKDQGAKALALAALLEKKIGLVENIVSLNSLAVKLGDEMSAKGEFEPAIQAYRNVRSRDEVIKFQNERIAVMEKRIETNLKSVGANPQAFVAVNQANNKIKAILTEAKQLLGEFEKLPDFTPTLLLRMSKCWYDWDRKWEAIVVNERILTRYPDDKAHREPAMFSMIIAYGDLMRISRCQQLCEQYIKEFPDGPNAGTVGYLSGAVALQANDPKSAESYFGTMLEKQATSEYREKMRYLLGVAKFMQGRFADANKDFLEYLKSYPNGEDIEEVTYRSALAQVFGGDYEKGEAALNAYLEKYPSGKFVADSKYRIMVCKYAAQKLDDVIADAAAWRQQYPNEPIAGEVYSLLGDSYAAESKEEEAAAAYTDAYKHAATDEVINYALFEASKHLQKLGKWAEVSAMFEAFIKEKPDHQAVVAAMYWIGKAKAREGKTAEAKQFLVETLKTYIGDKKREAVEQLLQQLAQLCSKRPRPAPAPAPTPAADVQAVAAAGAPAAPAPTAPATPAPPEATPVPYDAVAELETQIHPLEENANATARARLLYVRAELARLRKKDAEADALVEKIAQEFQPPDLSPVLLAQSGDFFLHKKLADRATPFYKRLQEDFPKSDYLDFAYVGLAQIAFDGQHYEEALDLDTDAIEKYSGMKVKEATIGKAQALLELHRYDESKKLFEQIAGMREWRGESTAQAVYLLGEIEERQGHWAEAIAHYQRVYVAYQKFTAWVARAYLHSAQDFEKLGKHQEAVNSLQEMLRNDRLQSLPEADEAHKMLTQWGAAA